MNNTTAFTEASLQIHPDAGLPGPDAWHRNVATIRSRLGLV